MTVIRPLPVRVPLVQAETLDSYLSRLAASNHLNPRDLCAYLGMRTRTRPPDLDRLAIMTGHPPHRLSSVLADACPPSGRNRLTPLPGRVACRQCTARRGISGDVYCVNADQRLCCRHRRWLGGLSEDSTHQHNITSLPDVVRAQRRHYRLVRRHGTHRGRDAIYWAGTIIDRWSEGGDWDEHRCRRLAVHCTATASSREPDAGLSPMVNYPEIVTLASLIADDDWRAIASADHRRDRVSFDREVARRLGLACTGFDSGDPLVSWQEAEAVVRRQRLHEQPGYRGPEVWLSTSA